MISKSQKQALSYFESHAQEWLSKAQVIDGKQVNVIAQRNQYVAQCAQGLTSSSIALDVGCGTGDLVMMLSSMCEYVVGVDYAAKMIELCVDTAKKGNIANVEFHKGSFFDYRPEYASFDLVAANGFIEYLSLAELHHFFEKIQSLLSPEGRFVFSARNRLFNVFSLNDYTRYELQGNAFNHLIEEALKIANCNTVEECIACLKEMRQVLPHLNASIPTPIGVEERRQYTPAELINLMSQYNMVPLDLMPIHYHGVIPRFAGEYPWMHADIATKAYSDVPGKHYLLPNASAFMICAKPC